MKEIKNSKNTPLLTLLLEGKNGCGKTALASKFAKDSDFPFVKIISPETFVGYSEPGKISQIVKIFDDAYKSPLSLIVLDDIERLIEFIHIGPRFSNAILQTLLVLIKKKPPHPERKLMIIGTTSMKSILQEMELVDCFNVCLNVPSIKLKEEVSAVLSQFNSSGETINRISNKLVDQEVIDQGGIPIKDMILSVELALQANDGAIEFKTFMDSFTSVYKGSF
jgi:vesicle-fusing ATPase